MEGRRPPAPAPGGPACIESDIGLDRGVEKITFAPAPALRGRDTSLNPRERGGRWPVGKAAKTGEECEVDPDLFDEILNSPKGPTPGVFGQGGRVGGGRELEGPTPRSHPALAPVRFVGTFRVGKDRSVAGQSTNNG